MANCERRPVLRPRVVAAVAVVSAVRSLPVLLIVLVIAVVSFPGSRALAQSAPSGSGSLPTEAPTDHSAHHPGGPAPSGAAAGMSGMSAPSNGPAANSVVQAGGGCGGMMGCMGGGAKPFYASLMDMPELTPEARRFIETEATRRLGAGSETITAGQASLHHALATNDPATMQQAVARVREGVQQVESGTSMLRALNEGQQPRQFALTWFKQQASLPVGTDRMAGEDGPWGLSWYHVSTMVFLVAFLLWASVVHFVRGRRIGQLIQRLTPGGPAAQGGIAGRSVPAVIAPAPAATLAPTGKAAPVATPAIADAPPSPARPWSGVLRVAAIFRETPEVKTFRLMQPDSGPLPFTFLPGQFLTFSAEIDGKRIRRSYTIASSPTQRDYAEITVKREPQGLESRYLHDRIAVGDLLEVSGPSGVFTFTGNEAYGIVLISGGVGITPMMCVIRYLTDRAYAGDIFFLYGARTTNDFIFREELEYLQKRHKNLHVAATMSRAEGTAWMGAEGLVSKEFIARSVPEIARRRVHLCGPPPMMASVKAELAELGVAKENTKTEAFGPALGAAAAPWSVQQTALPESEVVAVPLPAAVDRAASVIPSAQAHVEFRKSGKSGSLAPDQCVLEAAEAIGVAIDFSCRVGTCGTCVVPLLEGSVTMEVEDGLPAADKARGIILACQAKSVGNIVVDA